MVALHEDYEGPECQNMDEANAITSLTQLVIIFKLREYVTV